MATVSHQLSKCRLADVSVLRPLAPCPALQMHDAASRTAECLTRLLQIASVAIELPLPLSWDPFCADDETSLTWAVHWVDVASEGLAALRMQS